jgi:hypothetical protein
MNDEGRSSQGFSPQMGWRYVTLGFETEGLGVAGIDKVRRTDSRQASGIIELGLMVCWSARLPEPKDMREAVELGGKDLSAFAEEMADISIRWLEERDLLVGISWGFMELHEKVTIEDTLLDEEARNVLSDIAKRERDGLEVCRSEIEGDARREIESRRGIVIARTAVGVYCAN